MIRQVFILILISILALTSCSNKKLRANLTPDERLALAKEMFEKRSYLDAITQFRIITLSYAGSSIVDEAQYYLADCHFQLKEYILAASEFERLTRVFPNSEWVDDAQFKIGLCYFKLSPKYSLDQGYTLKAIDSFQQFLEDFSTSELVPQVQQKLNECRYKLAQKEYAIAEQYRKLKNYHAAIIYYDSVIEKYYDTEFSPRALYHKAVCLIENRELDQAIASLESFLLKYPNNAWAVRAQQKLKQTKEKVLISKQAGNQAIKK